MGRELWSSFIPLKGETQILVLFGEIVTIATITNDHKLNISFEQWIYHTNAMQLDITPASIRRSKIYPQHPMTDEKNYGK